MEQLTRDQRLRLLKFVCSFAWADLRVTDAERAFVRGLVERMHLDQDERSQVASWLHLPPEDVDPAEVPPEHRRLFVDTTRKLLETDGVAVLEHESFKLFEELLR